MASKLNKVKVAQAAKRYAAKGNHLKALKEYQRIVNDDPTDIRIWLKIGDLYSKCNEPEKAVSTYLKIAEYYTEQGFFLKAVAVYKQAIKLDQSEITPNLKLAELYRRLGLFSEAMQQYEEISIYYHRNGNTKEALAAIKKLVELDPENMSSRIKLAELYSQENMTTEAVDEFNKVADYLRETGEIDDFLKVGERLMYLVPENFTIAKELAGLYLRNGQPQQALRNLQQAFATNTKDVETLELLAQSFVDLSREDKAISVLKELARILGEENQQDRRLQIFRRVLELSPHDDDALEALGVDTSTVKSHFGAPHLKLSGGENVMPVGEADIEMLEELDVADVDFIEDDELITNNDQASNKNQLKPSDQSANVDALMDSIMKTESATSAMDDDSLLIEISMDDDEAGMQASTGATPRATSSGDHVAMGDSPGSLLDNLSAAAQEEIRETLEESEFFIQQNLTEEARSILNDLRKRFPNIPSIEDKLNQLTATGATGSDTAQRNAADLGLNRSNASQLGSAALGMGDTHAAMVNEGDHRGADTVQASSQPAHSDTAQEDFGAITIAAEIQAEVEQHELDPPSDTDFAAALDLNINDVIGELKKGVLKSEVQDDDANTHYDLGIAYREMEMYDAAISEFNKAKQSDELGVMSLVMIASCQSAQDQYEAAKILLQKAQIHKLATEREHIAIQFELAQIHAKCGEIDEARELFEDIKRKDPTFSNVGLQLDMLDQQPTAI